MDDLNLQYDKFYNALHGTYVFPLAYLEDLPTLCTARADNLKIDTGSMRVWLCRCGIADGMPYDNQVTIEHLKGGRWVETAIYQAV